MEVENPSEYMLSGKAGRSFRFCSGMLYGGNPSDSFGNTGTGLPQQFRQCREEQRQERTYNRVNLLMAVLEKTYWDCHLSSDCDAYVNIAGWYPYE